MIPKYSQTRYNAGEPATSQPSPRPLALAAKIIMPALQKNFFSTPLALGLTMLGLLFLGSGCPQSSTAPPSATATGAPLASAPLDKATATVPANSLSPDTGAIAGSVLKPPADAISGTVVDGLTGRPIPQATVNSQKSSLTVKTDINGHFRLETPVPLTLTALADNYDAAPDITASPGDEARLVIKPHENPGKTIVEPEATLMVWTTGLRVTVKDKKTGEPVSGLGLLTLNAAVPGAKNRVTGPDGSFLDTDITPGIYRFNFVNPQNSPDLEPYLKKAADTEYLIQVVPDYLTTVNLLLEK